MAKRRNKQKDLIVNELQKEIRFGNGLSEAIMGFKPGGVGTQIDQSDTLFKNNRWYLISNMRQLLSQIYVEHGLIQTVVDVPVDDAFRGGVKIITKEISPEEVKGLEKEMNSSDDETGDQEEEDILSSVVGQANKWNRLYGGAGILIISDQDSDTPFSVDQVNENSMLQFRAVDMWELFWDKQNTEGYDAELQMQEFEFYNYYGRKVHKSRVMKLKGIRPPSFIRPRLRGWGISCVEPIVRSINQYLKANGLTFEVLDEFKVDVFKMKDLANIMMRPGGEELVRKRVQEVNTIKNYLNALILDAEDDYVQKELSFAGISDTMAGIRMQVASELRMPLTKIFGISSAGFSSGEDDIENYNAMIESEIRSKSKHHIIRIIKIKCKQKYGFIPSDLDVEFKPLRILSAEMEENVKTQKFNRLLSAKTAGEISSKEFRDACNKDNLLPVQLDTDDKAMLEVEEEKAEQKDFKQVPEVIGSKKHKAPEAKEAE